MSGLRGDASAANRHPEQHDQMKCINIGRKGRGKQK